MGNAPHPELRGRTGAQNPWLLWAGSAWNDLDLVFTMNLGGSVATRNFIRRYKHLRYSAGIRSVSFHTIRHTHATMLLRENVHAKIVSERLGHSSIAITLDTYSHVLPNMQQSVVESIERALYGAG